MGRMPRQGICRSEAETPELILRRGNPLKNNLDKVTPLASLGGSQTATLSRLLCCNLRRRWDVYPLGVFKPISI